MAEEVGATFIINDRATAPLEKIAAAAEGVQAKLDEAASAAETFSSVRFAGVTRSIGALTDRLTQAGDAAMRLSEMRFGGVSRSIGGLTRNMEELAMAADAMPAAMESSMSRVVGEVDRAAASMRILRGEAAETTAALGGLGGGLGGRRGGGGGGGGGHGGPRGHLRVGPGGAHPMMYSPFNLPGLAAGFLGYEGIKMAAQYDLDLTNAAMSLGEASPSSDEGRRVKGIIDETVTQGTRGTKFAAPEVAGALPAFYGIVGSGIRGSPEGRAQQLQGLTGTALRFSEAETQMHHGSLEENMRASGEFAHLFRQYTPEQMGPIFDKLLAISRLTGYSPEQIERIAKYAETTGGLTGMNSDEILSTIGFDIQSGMGGTSAGTGMSTFMTDLLKGEKDPAARKRATHQMDEASRMRRQFENAVKGDIGVERQSGESEAKSSERQKALIELGVLDPKTHKVAAGLETAPGHISLIKVLELLSSKFDKMNPEEFGQKIITALDQRAARAIEPFMGKEQMGLFHQYLEMEAQFTKNIGVLQTQAEQATTPMQEMQQAWARAKEALMNAMGPLDNLGKVAKSAADGLESLSSWFKANKLDMKIEDPAKNTIGGWKRGEKVTPSDLFGGLLDSMGLPSRPSVREPNDQLDPPRIPRTGPLFGPQQMPIHRDSFNPGGDVHVNIQNISFGPGTPRDHADQFVQELTARLRRSQQNDLGTGWGTTQSPYSAGRTLST